MLIRSQDRKSLIDLRIIRIHTLPQGSVIVNYVNIAGDYDVLGTYSTEEKAMKVIDMIQNKYLEYCHLKGGPAILKGSIDIAENMWKVPKVFDMPQDEEVE